MCNVKPDLARERWKKLVWNIPFNGLAIAAGGIDVAEILADPDLEFLARQLMREVISSARQLGHELPASLVEDQIKATHPMGPYKPSSLIDFLEGARGRDRGDLGRTLSPRRQRRRRNRPAGIPLPRNKRALRTRQ